VGVIIRAAETPEDYAAFGRLIVTYEGWLRSRYNAVPNLINQVAEHQNLDAELADLPAKYGPPGGVVLLATVDDALAGGGAYRDLGDGTCEMKRLYVEGAYHGRGIGRQLCEALVERAAEAGYTAMRLDTGFRNEEALALYASLGFVERDDYSQNPPEIAQYLRFMERPL
jgi:ribosomal protein S18 acetylase RimI-like enzyme